MVCAGTVPRPGQPILPNCRDYEMYVNRHLFPSLFSEDDIKHMTSLDHQELFQMRELWMRPYANSPTANGGDR